VEVILAKNIFQRHVIVGRYDNSRASARLDGLSGSVSRSGEAVAVPADLQANTGNLIAIVRQVAAVAGKFADGLRAGQFIIAGSVIPPLFVAAGETVSFDLAPIGAVSVNFAA